MRKQDPIDFVNHLRLELDSRSPRTRLAVFGTLVENGWTEHLLETCQAIAAWVGEDVDKLLADYLEDALTNIPEEDEIEIADKPEGGKRDGGYYL